MLGITHNSYLNLPPCTQKALQTDEDLTRKTYKRDQKTRY
jgi:hypothetical protein